MKEAPQDVDRKEKFLELWEWFYCLAVFKVCSLTACAGGMKQVTPAGMCLLVEPSFWHKNIWSYFSLSLLFLTWRCQTNANCFGQGTVFLCQRGMQERKDHIGIQYVICDWAHATWSAAVFQMPVAVGWETWHEHFVRIWPYLFLGGVCMCLFILWIIT